MKLEISFDSCSSKIIDLENYRDADGFIDLTKTDLVLTPHSKEKRGNQNRVKNWVNFHGDLALVKGEIILEDVPNSGVYAELIVEELGHFYQVPFAHYDLVRIQNEKGEIIRGVLSMNMLQKGEELLSLHELIGEEPSSEDEFLDATSYSFAMKQLEDSLKKRGFPQEKVMSILIELKKRFAFSLLVLATDNHEENYSFIDGKTGFRVSPMYDNESSLLLDNDQETVSLLLNDYAALQETASIAQPRIGTFTEVEDGGLGSYWMDTLEALIEEDEVYDYCVHVLGQEVDMDSIFSQVESRIQAKLPEEVKLLSKHAYQIRRKDFFKIVRGEME